VDAHAPPLRIAPVQEVSACDDPGIRLLKKEVSMTGLWYFSLALEVALLVVFALVVATSLLTRGHRGATVSTYPQHSSHGRVRDRHAA
jgi:hypothetical protein